MPRKIVGVASTALHVITLLILAASILPVPWLTFTYSGSSLTFSLYSCDQCPSPFRHISPDCFKNGYCTGINGTSGLCTLGPKLQQGANFYFYSACVGLLFLVLNLERLSYILQERDYGHPKLVMLLIPLPVICLSIGVGGWYGSISPQFTVPNNNSDTTAEPNVQVQTGGILALVALLFSISSSCTLGYFFYHRNKGFDAGVPGIGEGKIIAFTFRNWLLTKVGPVLLIGLVFIIVSFTLPWIKFEDDTQSYQGNLVTMLDQVGSWGKVRYECMWGPACDDTGSTSSQMICTAFKRMTMANSIYLGIECGVILLLVLWLEGMIYFILKREFGIPILIYIWAPLASLLHASAVGVWFLYGKARIGSDCKVASGATDISFCAQNGASFTIWEALCFIFAAIFYELLYYRRKDGFIENEIEDVSPEIVSKLDMTNGELLDVPKFSTKAFESDLRAPPPSGFTSKVTELTLISQSKLMHKQQQSQNPFRPTMETLEEKMYCAGCDEE